MNVRSGSKAAGMFAGLSAWWCFLFAPSVLAQPAGQPATLLAPQTVSLQVLQQAQEFESREQWGQALLIYQQALKQAPRDQSLLHKLALARIHYDLSRRYVDVAFLKQIQQTDLRRALHLYSEILQKINSYHVETPDWHALSRYGLTSLQVALGHKTFRQTFLPQRTDAQIQEAWNALQAAIKHVTVHSRTDSLGIAERTVQIMHERLELAPAAVIHEFISGAIAALDLYSSFMTQDQYQDTMSQIDGNFVGLGVELKLQQDALEIVSVIQQGPAGRGDIRAGDKILAVDEQFVTQVGAERCADLLRGVEGSSVTVLVQRPNGQLIHLQLQRQRVDIPSFDHMAMIEPTAGIAYLRLANFQKSTGQDLDTALWQLHRQGMRYLIIDVRGNPGGLLTAAVDVANRFIDHGILVSTKGRNPLEDFTHHAQPENTWRVPLIVLIDENSASASEIFAAAIADHGRGKIVGQQSYGKGSVQGIFPLSGNQGGLRLTTALFYSPRGYAISHRGVIPDVVVQQAAKPVMPVENERPPQPTDDAFIQAAVGLFLREAPPPSIQQTSIRNQP